MSAKRKLESLASLGLLKDSDVKKLQTRLDPRGLSINDLLPNALFGLKVLIAIEAVVMIALITRLAQLAVQLPH